MGDGLIARYGFVAEGQVQGVGFRPFIWRLARQHSLSGFVRNTSAGARIEVQGKTENLEKFAAAILAEAPPLAKITALRKERLEPLSDESGFVIGQSVGHASQNVLVSPDVGVCADCLADMADPLNPRFGYAFTNCVNCGPRFSITARIPYDRPGTSMACFPLCADCQREYQDPENRRFHAQPIACPKCGPCLWYVAKSEAAASARPPRPDSTKALDQAARLILAGGILALKGLGGFQLACDARNAEAVRLLRVRKNRPHKALAVMCANLASSESFCQAGEAHKRLLASPEKPVVLCPKRTDAKAPLVEQIAPDSAEIGVMLPYTPLHALLLARLEALGLTSPVLVMTSANPAGEPICLGNREALARLAPLADGWLLHDRDILSRVDDSVVAISQGLAPGEAPGQAGGRPNAAGENLEGVPCFIRRARGYVPRPIALLAEGPPVIGAGAELKATFCVTRGDKAFVGQHIGDLRTPKAMDFYTHSLRHLLNLLECEPLAVAHDLHPDFMSTAFALELAHKQNLRAMPVQHHLAHAAAVLAENSYSRPALALCLDGSGLGEDGTIWGGELLYVDLDKARWQRMGGLTAFALPGGDRAIEEPWRLSRSLQWQNPFLERAIPAENRAMAAVDEMLARKLNCPLASGCGRLFDAVSALLGLCRTASYEGQAAMRLELAAGRWFAANPTGGFALNPCPGSGFLLDTGTRLDSQAIYAACANRLGAGWEIDRIAAAFHVELAGAFARLARESADGLGVSHVALGGGVMHNAIFGFWLRRFLNESGLSILMPKELPPGDGGISFGQAVWAGRLMATM